MVIAVTTVASLAAAAVLVASEPLRLRIELDPSSEPLLPANDPAAVGYRQAVLDFGDDEVFVLAMETDGVFSAENLAVLRDLCRALPRIEGVRSAESVVNVTTIRNDPQEDWLEVGPLVREIPTDAEALDALRTRALADPLLARSIVSSDGRTAAINVRLQNWSDHLKSEFDQ